METREEKIDHLRNTIAESYVAGTGTSRILIR